jgi:gas vesicle protein
MAPILEGSTVGHEGGRVNEQSKVMAGTLVGALIGAAGSYLFFTERGRELRDRIEPAVDEMRHEFARFQGTIEKVGAMANDGLRMMNEFNAARAQAPFISDRDRTSH